MTGRGTRRDGARVIILNIAVGGYWGGSQGVDPDVYPQRLVVDDVRVYEADPR